jgi:methyltransferase (TIGR00027 family)
MLDNTPSRTAEIVALIRALEFSYYGENSLLKDKYAARFLSDFYMAIFNRLSILPEFVSFFVNGATLGLFDFVTLRHAFMDSYVKKNAPQMPVALLGAGYDSRSLRLRDAIKHGIWEFDFPATQRRKKFYLRNERAEGDYPHYCEVDFMKESLPEIFASSGIPRKSALVLWEGVSMYVSEDIVRNTLTSIRDFFGSGAMVIFDYWHSSMEHPVKNLVQMAMPYFMDLIYNEKFTFGATPAAMRTIAMSCGAKKFETFNGKQMMAKLSLTSRLPLTSASMAVVTF